VSTYIGLRSTGALTAEKRSWLLGPTGTRPGENPSVTLDVSSFTAGTHYPNGYIPSGTVLGTITAGTTGGVWMVGPYDNAASDGRQTAVGILLSSVTVPVPTDTTQDVGAAMLTRGDVDPAKLPFTGVAGALDTAGRADLPQIAFAPVTP
jgi:hypothetical protein